MTGAEQSVKPRLLAITQKVPGVRERRMCKRTSHRDRDISEVNRKKPRTQAETE